VVARVGGDEVDGETLEDLLVRTAAALLDLGAARGGAVQVAEQPNAARERERTGASVLGVKAILSRDPLYRPSTLARSPAPRVHAATKAARKAFY